MSESHGSSVKPGDEMPPNAVDEGYKQREKVFGILLEKLNPWLLEFGNWIFGGLLAFNLVMVAPLLTLDPANLVILVSIAAFACALPLNLSGIFVLKLIRDMNDVAIDDVMKQAFQDAEISDIEEFFPAAEANELPHKRRTDVGLRYSIRLAALGAVLTLIGMVAALFYMAWWVAVIFVLMVIVSLAITISVVGPLLHLETKAERDMKRRNQEQRAQWGNKRRKKA